MSHTATDSQIVIRTAAAEDEREIKRLAGLDSRDRPAGPLLLATVGRDIRAAISLSDGDVVADPFHRTAELVEMLRIRARGASQRRGHPPLLTFRRPRRGRLALRSVG